MRCKMSDSVVQRAPVPRNVAHGEIPGMGRSTRILVMSSAEFWRACQPWSGQSFAALKAHHNMLDPMEVSHASAFKVVVLELSAVLALEHWSAAALFHTQEPHKTRVLFTGQLPDALLRCILRVRSCTNVAHKIIVCRRARGLTAWSKPVLVLACQKSSI